MLKYNCKVAVVKHIDLKVPKRLSHSSRRDPRVHAPPLHIDGAVVTADEDVVSETERLRIENDRLSKKLEAAMKKLMLMSGVSQLVLQG